MPVGLIDHFNIVIAPSQVDETLRFYREVLGLVEGFRPDFGRPGWWLYAGDHPVLQIFFRDTNGLRIELDYRKSETGF